MTIFIEEKPTKKVPGITSLYVTFEYDQNIVNALKKCDVYSYDKKTKTWEIPITNLTRLVDSVIQICDVNLKLLETKQKEIKERILKRHKTIPFKHQNDAVNYGLDNDCFLLNDEPGLGKTGSMIYLAEELKEREQLEHCLVVCGINSLKTNWAKEIKKHSDLDSTIIGHKINSKGKVTDTSIKERTDQLLQPISEFFVIVNIESLRSDDIIKAIKTGPNKYDMIVADEVHHFKNPTAQQTKNFMKLTSAKHKIGLTGTLLTNNVLDAYVPFTWLGVEHSSFTTFKNFYCIYDDRFHNILMGFKNTKLIQQQLDSFTLRRTKNLLDLPPKTVIKEIVEMESEQEKFYNDVKAGIRDEVDKVKLTTANVLALTARLRQATVLPSILTTSNIPSAKLNRCCELIDEIVSCGDKVVVLSVFKDPIYELEKMLSKYNPVIGTGDIPDDVVSSNIDKFQQDPECKVFLGTHAKCGTGITLDAASYSIILDELWTPADNKQSEDRIHRLTSKKPVFIYYLLTKNTIDEHVDDVVSDKSLVIDYIVDGDVPTKCVDRLKELILDI